MRLLSRFVTVAAALTFALPSCSRRGEEAQRQGGTAAVPEAVVLRPVYGSEKKAWLEEQVKLFEASGATTAAGRPIRIEAKAMGSGEAVQAIAAGELKPHVFSPASSAYLPLLDSAWMATSGRTRKVVTGGEALVLSPVVIAMWKPMAEALGWPDKALGWSDLLAVHTSRKGWEAFGRPEWGEFKLGHTHPEYSNSGLLSVLAEAYAGANRGWPAIGGKPEWGFVKLGHTDPTPSNSGLQALLLMTYEFWNKTSGLTVSDLLDPKYQAFVSGIERGVTKFETSTGTFMVDMVRFGPSRYDIAVVYESSVLNGPWVTPAQRAAARRFVGFLRSKPMQERALAYGFRPADPSVPVRTADAQNPFTRLAPYGLRVEIPPAATSPDPAVIRNLLTMWARVVQAR